MKVIKYTDVESRQMPIAGPGIEGRVVIGQADGEVDYCMRVFELAPGAGIPVHTHPWEHQQFYHAGTGYIVKDGEKVDVGPGTVVYVAPEEEHHIKNTGDETMVVVCLVPKKAPEM